MTRADHTDRRRLRARPVVLAAAVVGVLLLAGGLAVALDDDPSDGRDSEPSARTEPRTVSGRLVEMAPGSLSPRNLPVTAWTGDALVVVGGGLATDDTPPASRDGAAYDPDTDTWRPIADAPAPVDARQFAVWTGAEMVVAATTGVLAYDPEADTWRTLSDRQVPSALGDAHVVMPVPTPQGIVYPSPGQPDQPDDEKSLDLLVSDDGTVTSLPRDPFGASSDRSLAWDGERLWLLSTSSENDQERSDDDDQATSRLAVLEGGLSDGTWSVVDDETPRMAPESLLWWCENRLVVDRTAPGQGQTFDPGSDSWTRTGAQEAALCALSATERDGLAGGSSYDALGARFALDANAAADCPSTRGTTAYVWADDDLLVWDSLTTLGCRSGGPPGALTVIDPCPIRLVSDDRTRRGFGPVEPAARAPSLPEPEAAYLCRYAPSAPPPSLPDEAYTWESDLCCEPVRLSDAETARLMDYLADLTPPEAGSSCPADQEVLDRPRLTAGPRYLVSLRTDDELTGVVVDDFGCGHVRLTDDPFEREPGTRSGPGGIVPGVLQAPPELVVRLLQAVQLRYDGVRRFPDR